MKKRFHADFDGDGIRVVADDLAARDLVVLLHIIATHLRPVMQPCQCANCLAVANVLAALDKMENPFEKVARH